MSEAKGGKRAGSGRKKLYDDPLSKKSPVRLNDEQAKAISGWCTAKSVSALTFLREAALKAGGAASRLGRGLEQCYGTTRNPEFYGRAAIVPVTLTDRQYSALQRVCGGKLAVATFIREAALREIGRSELGVEGETDVVRDLVGRAK